MRSHYATEGSPSAGEAQIPQGGTDFGEFIDELNEDDELFRAPTTILP